MKKLLILVTLMPLVLFWCVANNKDNKDDIATLQKQIDEIKNLPSIKQQFDAEIEEANRPAFETIIVSDDSDIWSKIEQIKQNVFKKMKYEVVTSGSKKWSELINKFWVKYLPMMIAWDAIKQTEIKDFLDQLAVEKDWQYNIDLSSIAGQMRIAINKTYLQTPKPLDYDWVKWPENAKVVMIEYSDFECPFCAKFYEWAYKQIVEQYWDKIQIRFKHLPLAFHSKAQKAAEASQCALRQWKFWEMHDKLFENQADLSVDNYKKWAWEMGLEAWEFSSCLDTWATTAEVEFLAKQAWAFWIQWTPWVFINQQFVSWAYPFEEFQRMIEEELVK